MLFNFIPASVISPPDISVSFIPASGISRDATVPDIPVSPSAVSYVSSTDYSVISSVNFALDSANFVAPVIVPSSPSTTSTCIKTT